MIALVFGIPIGVLAGAYPRSVFDYATRFVAIAGVSLPSFWLALIAQSVFFSQLGWLPLGSRISRDATLFYPIAAQTGFYLIDAAISGNWRAWLEALHHLILPAIVLAAYPLGVTIRMTQASMLEVLSETYVTSARAAGLPRRVILFKLALKNAIMPALTVVGLSFAYSITGAFLVETIFSWPGVGKYVTEAVLNVDFPVIIAVTLVVTIFYILVNLLVDLVQAFIDPRGAVGLRGWKLVRIEVGSSAWFLLRDRAALISMAFLILIALSAVFAPLLTPYASQGMGAPDLTAKFKPPGIEHPLGTDGLGRDQAARLMFGARRSLSMGLLVVLIAIVIGTPLGIIAGYLGGWIDEAIMRVTDVFLAFPPLLLAIAIAAALGASYINAVMAIAATWWPWYARLARSQTLSVRERAYIEAAHSIGVSRPCHHRTPHSAKHHDAYNRARDAGRGHRHSCRRWFEFHRPRHPGALRRLGRDDQRWAAILPLGPLVDVHISGLGDFSYRHGFQFSGRWRSRGRRSAAAKVALMAILTVENLHVQFKTPFGAVYALRGIDFELARGEILGLVGETGCGKSVTGRSIMRLLDDNAQITAGRIMFEERDLLQLPDSAMREVRGTRIAMVFQDPATALNPLFTIGQQINDVLRAHAPDAAAARRSHTIELLSSVGLPDPAHTVDVYPHQLSGGQQQRAMIALSLAAEPDVIIADEPTTALDVTIQAQILDLLRTLQHERAISVILITHDLGIVAETCQQLVVLYAGRVVEAGSVAAVFADPKHPYTRGLLAALPRPGSRGSDLKVIPGAVPSGLESIDGCAFAPRCDHVMERCRAYQPALTSFSAAHHTACFLHEAPVNA